MMLPILISVSVAPVSYFFWASALPPLAASKMMAVENAANRRATKDISFLPDEINECVLLMGSLCRACYPVLNTRHYGLSI
jgi:hypothetical protein